MPVTNVKEAQEWREKNRRRRPSLTSHEAVAKEVNAKKEQAKEKPKKKKRRATAKLQSSGDSLADALERTRRVSEKAYEMLAEAMDDDRIASLSALISIHSKASEAHLATEKAYREEAERRNELISVNDAQALFRKGFDFLIRRLKQMPSTLAPKCNQENPLLALGVLEKSINTLIADGQKQYKAPGVTGEKGVE